MTGKTMRIGVVLAGCGVYDGSEIHEAVCTLLAISRAGAEAVCYAPDIDQAHVVDHRTGQESGETRNVLVESARIARGKIQPLSAFTAEAVDALVIPGGFGAAKNLSDFAFKGADCTVNPEVVAAVALLRAAGKPIGALCIAPTILAALLGQQGVELTIGQDTETAAAVEKLGARHRATAAGEVVIDEALKVVTSPCYMLESTLAEIAEGAENTVKALITLAR
ncbi:isoprenoid biosynthesis glyoxalase ElbB [Azospirillum doebereinerae]|uniref:Isoprenoid biosynthesis protein ElbB n=1 Tax=Azospirillum doebereinerae TaxID=92933 RepID=A0A433JFQ8_9PROT|nr:isoprenoid biosynthesis glyoxalase ElbB [Azospirillum doebereinerae]RUQ76006.1 isoprenoid biosynthesis protein ElbB [Azospirillum doebereinerae]